MVVEVALRKCTYVAGWPASVRTGHAVVLQDPWDPPGHSFLVPQKDGLQKPVINLKRLNSYTPHHHFKMEGIHTLRELLRQDDWLIKVDLNDAYFMVLIAQPFF